MPGLCPGTSSTISTSEAKKEASFCELYALASGPSLGATDAVRARSESWFRMTRSGVGNNANQPQIISAINALIKTRRKAHLVITEVYPLFDPLSRGLSHAESSPSNGYPRQRSIRQSQLAPGPVPSCSSV